MEQLANLCFDVQHADARNLLGASAGILQQRDSRWRTPLQLAEEKGQQEVVALLEGEKCQLAEAPAGGVGDAG